MKTTEFFNGLKFSYYGKCIVAYKQVNLKLFSANTVVTREAFTLKFKTAIVAGAYFNYLKINNN